MEATGCPAASYTEVLAYPKALTWAMVRPAASQVHFDSAQENEEFLGLRPGFCRAGRE